MQDTFSWKCLAKVVGKTEITLPESFSELLIVAHNAAKSYVYTIIVPHDCLTEEPNVYFRNGIGNQGNRDYVAYNINLSRILLASMFAANNDSTTSATTIAYYR